MKTIKKSKAVKAMECQRCFRVQPLDSKCKWCPSTKLGQLKRYYAYPMLELEVK